MDVRRQFHKRLTYGVHAMFEGKFQALPIALGECRDAQIDARQIQPFPGPQFAAHENAAMDSRSIHALDFQLNDAVVEEQFVTRFDDLRQAGEGH